jgi:hypothetical protein
MILVTTCDGDHRLRRPALRPRQGAGAAAVIAVLLSANAAAAQEVKRDSAAAEALFQEARKLVKAGDYAAGCPKFEAALALYPSASTMLNIADCREHEGKIASAWEAYHRALVLNRETEGAKRQESIAEAIKEGIRKLEPRLPKLLIKVESPPPGVTVLRDGQELPTSALGEALPADPGAHEVTVSAAGYRSETRSVTLREGETTKLDISLVKGEGSSDGRGVPTWVWVTGGAGIVLTGVSFIFLADNRSAVSALRENCPTSDSGTVCVPGYDYESDNARKNRGLGLFLGLGGAGVIAIGAATAGLILSSSSSSSSKASDAKAPSATASAWILPGSAGAVVSGRF